MTGALNGRVALITGASKGIGRDIAKRLAAAGCRVALTARDSESLHQAVAEIELTGIKAIAIPADATNPKSIISAVDGVIQEFGRMDILVNNVGGALRFGGFLDLADEDWERAFNLNVLSMVRFVRAALPWIEKSNVPRIINISSLAGVEPGRYNPHYTTTKAATINFGKTLANEFAAKKILVNTICPGPVHSEAWDENIRQTSARLGVSIEIAAQSVETEEAAKVPLGRIGEGSDIAGLVAFLASDEAAWITGTCFHVSGGKMKSI